MKRTCRNISSLILALMMVLSLSGRAFAADSSITFLGVDEGFETQPGSKYTATDLFDNFKDVMPGDRLAEKIRIVNEARDCDYIRVYLQVVVHDEQGNRLTYDESFENADGKDQAGIQGQRDEDVASMQDFLSQMTMRIYNGSTLIYEDSPEQAGDLLRRQYLGRLGRGEQLQLRVELDVPTDMGNEYADRVGEVDWVILAECYKDDKLIHTGQLNWPIYVLSIGGILLLAAGMYLMTRKRKDAYA